MEIDQILKLVEAGFSKDEILKLVQQTQPKDEPKTQPKDEPKDDPKDDPKQSSDVSRIDEAIEKLNTLADSISKLNIVNSQQPPQEGYEDMLAKIINPNFKGGN